MRVSYKGKPDIVKRLHKLRDGGEVAIKRTVSDFTNRAPAWVSKGIRQHYGVDSAAIKAAGPKKKKGGASVNVGGGSVAGASLEYKGGPLTLKHFKASPKKRPTGQQAKPIRVPGQAVAGAGDVAMIRPPSKYTVKATIIKGQRARLPANTFIASANGAADLPFQRTSAARMPIEVVHTLSVPQMIEGRARDTINDKINTELDKRFEHNIKQAIK
jgi:hypothetical protein